MTLMLVATLAFIGGVVVTSIAAVYLFRSIDAERSDGLVATKVRPDAGYVTWLERRAA